MQDKIIDFRDFFFGERKLIGVLIVLMTLSLLGIIFLQVFWLNEAYNTSKRQFNYSIMKSIEEVVDRVHKKEETAFKYQVEGTKIESEAIKSLLDSKYLLEDYLVPITKEDLLDLKGEPVADRQKEEVNLLKARRIAKKRVRSLSIVDRISVEELKSYMRAQLDVREIDSPFDLGVLDEDLQVTKVKTKKFVKKKSFYALPLFLGTDGRVTYFLSIDINRDEWLDTNNNLFKQTLMGVFFTLFLIVIFLMSFYYMYNQRKISQVKAEFINNMTHEFKTPIATINIAVEALKNSKVISDPKKIKHFANIIKNENKRMDNQVEMVLRMSRLEKNQLDLNFEQQNIHVLLEESISNISLIVEARGGLIVRDYSAEESELRVDSFHLVNIFLNILDNANKYSPEDPVIAVRTYNEDESLVIGIKDQGRGMSQEVMRNVFDTFYREDKGNIHEVKGHGLGLSYVKKIVNLHYGTVWVESTKDKGSEFFVKLPILD